MKIVKGRKIMTDKVSVEKVLELIELLYKRNASIIVSGLQSMVEQPNINWLDREDVWDKVVYHQFITNLDSMKGAVSNMWEISELLRACKSNAQIFEAINDIEKNITENTTPQAKRDVHICKAHKDDLKTLMELLAKISK